MRRTQEYLAYCKDDELKIAGKAHFRRFVLFQYSMLMRIENLTKKCIKCLAICRTFLYNNGIKD